MRRRLSLIKSGSTPPTPTLDYLCFTAQEPGSTVSMQAVGSAPSVSLEYSVDDGSTWSPFVVGSTTVTLANVGYFVYLRGDNTQFATSSSNYNKFVMTGKIAASGNIMSLLDKTMQSGFTADSAFSYLFYGCTSLTTPPDLPATTLADYCYNQMFYGCTSLTSAPELQATTLAVYCYAGMFYNCTSLISAPDLPATTLKERCYNQMFYGCSSLVAPPEISATRTAPYCCNSMFRYCTSLVSAPNLYATGKLETFCYYYMFENCTSLKLSSSKTGKYQTAYRIPVSGTASGSNVTSNMFSNTGGTFTASPSLNTTYYGAWD